MAELIDVSPSNILHSQTTQNILSSRWKEATLLKAKHIAFLRQPLLHILPTAYTSLDAARPWLIYWTTHALSLLSSPSPVCVIETIRTLQQAGGGFSGGQGQIAHLATTYAAVCALVIDGSPEALNLIDRPGLYEWLLRLKNTDGSFRMTEYGEVDVRGTYCALSVAKLLGLQTPQLHQNAGKFVVACQTWEGGIASTPHCEAHGGYTFCGIAALEILGCVEMLDMPSLVSWLVTKQCGEDIGGFCGRSNKLVDGCYSWWQGASAVILEKYVCSNIFDRGALQEYLLYFCQYPSGGMVDKPGKGADFYHTCYCLSGLSVTQHSYIRDPDIPGGWLAMSDDEWLDDAGNAGCKHLAVGGPENLLRPTHPVFNISIDSVQRVLAHFKGEPVSCQNSGLKVLSTDAEITRT